MRLEIFGEPSCGCYEKCSTDTTVRLKLIQEHSVTRLCAVDRHGHIISMLFAIRSDGTIDTIGWVSKDLGFLLIEPGRTVAFLE